MEYRKSRIIYTTLKWKKTNNRTTALESPYEKNTFRANMPSLPRRRGNNLQDRNFKRRKENFRPPRQAA